MSDKKQIPDSLTDEDLKAKKDREEKEEFTEFLKKKGVPFREIRDFRARWGMPVDYKGELAELVKTDGVRALEVLGAGPRWLSDMLQATTVAPIGYSIEAMRKPEVTAADAIKNTIGNLHRAIRYAPARAALAVLRPERLQDPNQARELEKSLQPMLAPEAFERMGVNNPDFKLDWLYNPNKEQETDPDTAEKLEFLKFIEGKVSKEELDEAYKKFGLEKPPSVSLAELAQLGLDIGMGPGLFKIPTKAIGKKSRLLELVGDAINFYTSGKVARRLGEAKDSRIAAALGVTSAQKKKLPPDFLDIVKKDKIVTPFDSPDTIARRAAEKAKESSDAINEFLFNLDSKFGPQLHKTIAPARIIPGTVPTKLTPPYIGDNLVQRLRAKADELALSGKPNSARQLRNIADAIEKNTLVPQKMSFSYAKSFKDEYKNPSEMLREQYSRSANRNAYNVISKYVDDTINAIPGVNPRDLQKYYEAKKRYHVYEILKKTAKKRADDINLNPTGGWYDMAAGGLAGGASALNRKEGDSPWTPLTHGVGGAVLGRFARTRGPGLSVGALGATQRALQLSPAARAFQLMVEDNPLDRIQYPYKKD